MSKKKEKMPRGSKVFGAHLDEEKVASIRSILKSGEYSQNTLALMFKVSASTISRIKKRRTWKHVK